MQGFSESRPLVRPPDFPRLATIHRAGRIYALQAFFDDETLAPSRRAAHHPSLVVEVATSPIWVNWPREHSGWYTPQHDEDTLPFATKCVLYGHLDIVKRDESSAGSWRLGDLRKVRIGEHKRSTHIASLDRLSLDTLSPLD